MDVVARPGITVARYLKDVMQSLRIGKEQPLLLGNVNTNGYKRVRCTCTKASSNAEHSTIFSEPKKLWLADFLLARCNLIMPLKGGCQASLHEGNTDTYYPGAKKGRKVLGGKRPLSDDAIVAFGIGR